jgi:hypothetical protein
MKINSSDLKKIYGAYVQNKVPQSREKCLSPAKILTFFAAPGSHRKKGRIIDHITSCAHCAHEFNVLLEIYREEQMLLGDIHRVLQQKDEPQISQRERAHTPIVRRLNIFPLLYSRKYAFSLLLTLIFVAMIILVTHQLIIISKNEERGKPPGQIQLIVPVHEERVKAPLIFKWGGVKNSNYYILEIFDEALLSLWKSPKIFDNSYQLPPEIEPKIKKNRDYFWIITVFLAEGQMFESTLESFRVIE